MTRATTFAFVLGKLTGFLLQLGFRRGLGELFVHVSDEGRAITAGPWAYHRELRGASSEPIRWSPPIFFHCSEPHNATWSNMAFEQAAPTG